MLGLILGTIFYLLIKVGGYTRFSKYLNELFNKTCNIWLVGSIRTALGLGLGTIVHYFLFKHLAIESGRSPLGGEDTWIYFLVLIFLRIFEWWLIIYWFYTSRTLAMTKQTAKGIVYGIICSFILDIPIMLGLISVIATIC